MTPQTREKAAVWTGEHGHWDVSNKNMRIIIFIPCIKHESLYQRAPASKTFEGRESNFLPHSSKDGAAQPQTSCLGFVVVWAHQQHAEKPGEEPLAHLLPDALHR